MNAPDNGLTSPRAGRNMAAMPSIIRRPISIWQLNVAMWSIFAVLFFIRALLHLDPGPALAVSAFHLSLCLIFSGLLIAMYRRLEQRPGFGVQTAAWIIGLSLAATIIQSVAAHGLLTWAHWNDPAWSPLDLWLMRMMFFWLVYMVWSLLYFWVKAERTAKESSERVTAAQAEAQRMELQLLRSQLNPHFLFNALNGIATVVQTDSPPAASMVRELADYLRYSLEHQHDSMVRLDRELEAMMNYLHIEQARFAEELEIEITTGELARSRQVPCFLLLPLVENALKHSFQGSEPPWRVTISAEIRDELLHIEVANTGTLSNEATRGTGVGLDILQRRLAIHYPDRHAFSLIEEDGSVIAILDLEGDPCSV